MKYTKPAPALRPSTNEAPPFWLVASLSRTGVYFLIRESGQEIEIRLSGLSFTYMTRRNNLTIAEEEFIKNYIVNKYDSETAEAAAREREADRKIFNRRDAPTWWPLH